MPSENHRHHKAWKKQRVFTKDHILHWIHVHLICPWWSNLQWTRTLIRLHHTWLHNSKQARVEICSCQARHPKLRSQNKRRVSHNFSKLLQHRHKAGFFRKLRTKIMTTQIKTSLIIRVRLHQTISLVSRLRLCKRRNCNRDLITSLRSQMQGSWIMLQTWLWRRTN